MKRLCVFYKNSTAYLGKPIEWIVCKGCQKKLRRGEQLHSGLAFVVAIPSTVIGTFPAVTAPQPAPFMPDFTPKIICSGDRP